MRHSNTVIKFFDRQASGESAFSNTAEAPYYYFWVSTFPILPNEASSSQLDRPEIPNQLWKRLGGALSESENTGAHMVIKNSFLGNEEPGSTPLKSLKTY